MAEAFHDMTMDVIMREWPATTASFSIVACFASAVRLRQFHTLSEAAREHSVDQRSLDRDIQIAIEAIKPADG